ncbi:MAG: Fic family protein [Fibrobacterota bacterium]
MAPPADRVHFLINNLLLWLKTIPEHPIVASCIFHYEFEFIHPFSDGNGRMGRLWQTLILSKWKPLWAYLPVETIISERQSQYYELLGKADSAGDATAFVEFMLQILKDTLITTTTTEVTTEVKQLLNVIKGDMKRKEIQGALKLKNNEYFRLAYLAPALSDGVIEMTQPDSPNSPTQRYRLTAKGRDLMHVVNNV